MQTRPSLHHKLSFLLWSYHATGTDFHWHCHSLIFLFCGEREVRSSVVINCFPWMVRFCPNTGNTTLALKTKSVFQEITFNAALHRKCSIWNKNVRILCSYSSSNTYPVWFMNAAQFHKGTVKFSAQNFPADCKCMLVMYGKIIVNSLQGLKSQAGLSPCPSSSPGSDEASQK